MKHVKDVNKLVIGNGHINEYTHAEMITSMRWLPTYQLPFSFRNLNNTYEKPKHTLARTHACE